MANNLNNPNFGSQDPINDPYTQTRATIGTKADKRRENEFEKRIATEIKYGRISDRTRREIINRELNGFVSRTISEKKASLDAVNTSTTQAQQQSLEASVEISESIQPQRQEQQNKTTINPFGIYIVDICINGEPHKLQLATYGGPYKEN